MTLSTTLGIPLNLQSFTPTREAVLARIAALSPATYARTRNALDGAVSGLSPYLTHGIVSLPEMAALVASKHRLGYDDKLVFEWGWREFFHHVWERAPQPDDILQNMREMHLWRGEYSSELPADIHEGRTGVPCIDAAVRQLYATGYLHNHARMWLASYCVHLRKVHWRVGADWLYAHLLDGDLPSNHLSWQWVASSFSSKPYLFNAENVAKYAPQSGFKAWISKGTVIDTSYEALDNMARTQGDVGAEPGLHEGVSEPSLFHPVDPQFLKQIEQIAGIASAQDATKFIVNRLQSAAPDTKVQLIHPWALHATEAPNTLRIGIIHTPAHQARLGASSAGALCSRGCKRFAIRYGSARSPSWPIYTTGQSTVTFSRKPPCLTATATLYPPSRSSAQCPNSSPSPSAFAIPSASSTSKPAKASMISASFLFYRSKPVCYRIMSTPRNQFAGYLPFCL